VWQVHSQVFVPILRNYVFRDPYCTVIVVFTDGQNVPLAKRDLFNTATP
jgi:hypothetical protein